ncbi:MAG: DUF3221 domain-containing protein [Dehalococcoidia bacterium]|jgi:hypothetical protein
MKYISLFGLAVMLFGLVVVSIGCASDVSPIETEADFLGFITEINPDGGSEGLGQISVESHADKLVTKYVITINDETLIFQQDGDNLRETDFEALENQQWVKIWFTGPVMESFPMQATAEQVVITDS